MQSESAIHRLGDLISEENRTKIATLLNLRLLRFADNNVGLCGLDLTPVSEIRGENEDPIIHAILRQRYLKCLELSELFKSINVPTLPSMPSVTVDLIGDKTIKRDSNIVYYKSTLLAFIAKITGTDIDNIVNVDTISYTPATSRDKKITDEVAKTDTEQ